MWSAEAAQREGARAQEEPGRPVEPKRGGGPGPGLWRRQRDDDRAGLVSKIYPRAEAEAREGLAWPGASTGPGVVDHPRLRVQRCDGEKKEV